MKNIIIFILVFSFLATPSFAVALDNAEFDGLIAKIGAEEYAPVKKFLEDKKTTLAKRP